jgi:hypothetical protein
MKKIIITFTIHGFMTMTSQAALVFDEEFGSLPDGTTLTTSNTDFTYIRKGSGASDPAVIRPAQVGSGSSIFVKGVSGSLTGVGVKETLTLSSIYTMSVNFRFTDVSSGNVVIGVGNGSSLSGNSAFNTSHGLFWLQSDNGNFEQRISGKWSNVNEATTFEDDTNYSLQVIANGGSNSLSYSGGDVAAGKMDIYLNGNLLEDDVAVTNSLTANGFRIYSVNGVGVEIDDIKLWNEAIAVPESSSAALLGLAGLVLLTRRRK